MIEPINYVLKQRSEEDARWRSAHSWLKGYSDAVLDRPENPNGTRVPTPDPAAYRRGYAAGALGVSPAVAEVESTDAP